MNLENTDKKIKHLLSKIKLCRKLSFIFILIAIVCVPLTLVAKNVVPLAICLAIPSFISIIGLVFSASISNRAQHDLDEIMVIVEEEKIRSDVRNQSK